MSAIPNLSNISNISRLGSVRRPNNKAYLFDWSNDYIAWDTTIGRIGYDLNVAGNVSTGSDSDGSYFWINWNRTATPTGTVAQIAIASWVVFTQATSFTIKAKFKFIAFPAASTSSGIFGSNFDAAIYLGPTALSYWLRGSSTVINTASVSINTLYDFYLVYDASTTEFYGYLSTSWGASVLQNVGWTTWPATFSTLDWFVGDNGIWGSTVVSCEKYIYHAAIRNVALTQAEIDADIALWNTTKSDSRIVAYYIPENLQYNTQYMTNPKALDQSNRVKTWATAVTADTTTAPDWTTTADQVAISWTATQWVSWPSTAITWSTLASKTLIVKAFVKVAAWTAAFRLWIWHTGVADYYSSNQTATAVRQEFTFTQALTSSTAGTWFSGGVFNDSTATNPTLEVRNVRVFVTNETLRDESPNIGWYIGRKTQKVLSFWIKPTADSVNTVDSQCPMRPPRFYCHMSQTTNQLNARFDNRLWFRTSIYNLWAWFRSRVHVVCVYYWTWSVWGTKIYINWVLQDSDTFTVDPPTSSYNTVLRSGRSWTTYYSWYIRDPRIYTFTWSFTDADALAIYNWLEPSSAWITKYLHWRPTPWETWTTAIDHSGNSRTGTLTGGVTRPFLSWS